MVTRYSEIAGEYYDAEAHPTIANLRSATEVGLAKLAKDLRRGGRVFCETGCGRPMLRSHPEFRDALVVGVDASYEMLRHAEPPVLQATVLALPFRSASFDGLFGSLADPYNTEEFYRE